MKAVPKPKERKKQKSAATGKVKKLDNITRAIVFRRDGCASSAAQRNVCNGAILSPAPGMRRGGICGTPL
jgi:hypothetical protein